MKKQLLLTSLFAILFAFVAEAQIFFEDFENGQNGWTFVDSDGDTYNWGTANASSLNAAFGQTSIVSWSYIDNVGILTPDNLAISPAIDLTASTANNLYLLYDYITQASYPSEKYSIYVTTSDNPSTITASTPVYTETVAVGGVLTENAIDLSSYIGQTIYITFRHYDCTDQYYLVVDNLELKELNNNDAQLLSIDNDKFISAGNQNIEGSFKNIGSQTITSAEVNWQVNNGTIYTQTVSGLNVAPFSSGSFTHPDVWNAQAGQASLKVWISKINNTALAANSELTTTINVATNTATMLPLLERFTSSTCAPCAGFNIQSFNNIYQQRHNEFAYVAYHVNWPGNGDPYYQPEAGTRRTFYGVNGVPSLFIGGSEYDILYSPNFGANNGPLNQSIDDELLEEAYFNITINSAHVENEMVNIDLSITPYLTGNYTVHAVLIEKETTGNVATNGETQFEDIMMKMIPNANGTSVNFTADSPEQLQLSANLANTFVEEWNDLAVVVFVQDNASKTILQSAKGGTTLAAHNLVEENTIEIYPNPTKNGTVFVNVIEESSVEIYDTLGKNVLSSTALNAGENTLHIDHLSQGIYMVKVTSKDKSYTTKLIIE